MNKILIAIRIIIQLETSDQDPTAVGDNGKALGWLQIHECVIDDVNKIYGCDYEHRDAFNQWKSYDIAVMYLSHWGRHYKNVTGKHPGVETYLRIWNGGPFGWKNRNTDKYLKKYKKLSILSPTE